MAEANKPPEENRDVEVLLREWISDTTKLHANMATRSKLSQFDDLIDDLLLRTEEFEHLLELVSSDASACLFKQVPVLQEHFSRMEEAFAGVERLEAMVAAVRQDVERTERLVAQAEDTVEANGIRAYIPNLFGPRAVLPSATSQFEPPVFFSAENFFKQ